MFVELELERILDNVLTRAKDGGQFGGARAAAGHANLVRIVGREAHPEGAQLHPASERPAATAAAVTRWTLKYELKSIVQLFVDVFSAAPFNK